MDLDLKSPFFLTQASLPLLRKPATTAAPASVINIIAITVYDPPACKIILTWPLNLDWVNSAFKWPPT